MYVFLITAKQLERTVIIALLHNSASLLLFSFVAFHYDMTKGNLLACSRSFSLEGLVQSSKKGQRKKNHYSVIEQNALSDNYNYGKYYKMFAFKK